MSPPLTHGLAAIPQAATGDDLPVTLDHAEVAPVVDVQPRAPWRSLAAFVEPVLKVPAMNRFVEVERPVRAIDKRGAHVEVVDGCLAQARRVIASRGLELMDADRYPNDLGLCCCDRGPFCGAAAA